MEFYKYHGAGNDFILLKEIGSNNPVELAKKMCHRRFGIGADGLMYPTESTIADIKMSYYNSDGSFATMCGNGLRCFSRFVYEKGILSKDNFLVETGDGVKKVTLNIEDNQVQSVTVEMSKGEIPIRGHHFDFDPIAYNGHFLEFGVPHLVLPVIELAPKELITNGPIIEKAPFFENGTNVNFVQIKDKNHIQVDTWERGAGYTYACGTGCCASVYVCYKKGLVDKKVNVETKGGSLFIELLEDDLVMMTGAAIKICKGDFLQASDQ